MYFGFCGIVIAMIVVFVLLAIDEIAEKESKCVKTVDLTNGLVHITIPSFDEWCESDVSISEHVPSIVDSAETNVPTETNEISETDIPTETPETNTEPISETTKSETDLLPILIAAGINKARATILINALGGNLLNIAKEGGIKALTRIKGIGEVTATKVVALANQIRKE